MFFHYYYILHVRSVCIDYHCSIIIRVIIKIIEVQEVCHNKKKTKDCYIGLIFWKSDQKMPRGKSQE